MTDHERPYRVVDYNGDVVADELDTVPPLLNQEQIDLLASRLSKLGTTSVEVYSALRQLPDSAHGAGEVGDVRPHCQVCDDEIGPEEPQTTRFGYFYHERCVP